ncbi:hypothetical protein C9374_003533 [Naegleria lovaniensis]|uniref:Uncharacterized protein n=1 Tax=Naegleria lovaniensis TaxID=51637 RepID=A0AA88KKF6_NAELO|nr:uncharacterized protein C9374_003533 [Naegleria lovaniensis]KAG2385718.1 hypothetical protein C9374_003533 [Naegleria lovaniensis]
MSQTPRNMSSSFRTTPSASHRKIENTPIEFYHTLDMVNTFCIQTINLLNNFSLQCERKLNQAQHDLVRIEITLSLLESKLKSIDGMEAKMKEFENNPSNLLSTTTTTTTNTSTAAAGPVDTSSSSFGGNVPPPPPPTTTTTTGNIPPPPPGFGSPQNTQGYVPPPPPMTSNGTAVAAASLVPPLPVTGVSNHTEHLPSLARDAVDQQVENSSSNIPTCEQDPRLARYFRLLYKVGVPRVQLERDMIRDGFDPSVLDTPQAPSPLGPYKEENSEEEEEIGGDAAAASSEEEEE